MDEKFIRAMFGTAEILGTEISQERVRGYWSVLGQFGSDAIVKALRVSLTVSPFFPAPNKLIEIITGETGDVESEAMAMWGMLLEVLHTEKAQQMIDADPRVRAGVNAAGGIFCIRTGVDDEPMKFKKLAFCRAFAGTSRMARQHQLTGSPPAHIAGIIGSVVETITEGER